MNKNEMNTTIQPGQVLKAKSICDSNCIFTVEILSRSRTMVTVKVQNHIKLCRVMVADGIEFIKAMGSFSMAPIFRADSAERPIEKIPIRFHDEGNVDAGGNVFSDAEGAL